MNTLLEELEQLLGPGGMLRADEAHRDGGVLSTASHALAVLRPRSAEEVSAILKRCHAAGQRVVVQGGMTGLVNAAAAAPDEIALSLERMNRIEHIDVRGRTMTVQAGVTLQAVHEAAEVEGLNMTLDLGARGSAMIGGNIATNAGGNQVIRYGMMREQVLGLEVVLADGTILCSMNQVLKNNTGYDLKHLFIGSEGTLGVVTRAVLRLRPSMPARNSALIATDSLDHLIALLGFIERELGGRMSAFEAMWNSYYSLACRGKHLGEPPLPDDYPFYVLVESSGADLEADAERFMSALGEALEKGLISDAVLAQSAKERAAFWAIRDNLECLATFWPMAGFDISLPVGQMEDYLRRCEEQLPAAVDGELRWATFGHLGDGNLHVIVALGKDDPLLKKRVEAVIYGELQSCAGSISAEHGIGLDKRDYLGMSRTPAEIAVMKALKYALDPKGILNRDRIFRVDPV